jgi:hypothetical protein
VKMFGSGGEALLWGGGRGGVGGESEVYRQILHYDRLGKELCGVVVQGN